MLNELRNINVDRMDVDDAVALLAFGNLVSDAFAQNKLKTPEWLDANLATLTREIESRKRESLEKRRKELRALIEADMTATERRAKHRRELDEIETALLKP
jgi:hypothetical protein